MNEVFVEVFNSPILYKDSLSYMQSFVKKSKETKTTTSKLLILEHLPVVTTGVRKNLASIISNDLLQKNNIKIIKSDRGGDITYHASGQAVFYCLFHMKTIGVGVKEFVSMLEKSVVKTLKFFDIDSATKPNMPGVYVGNKKISSLGIRIKNGYSYHGLSVNFDMDLTAFSFINPCGYKGLEMCNVVDFCSNITKQEFVDKLKNIILNEFGYKNCTSKVLDSI
jgi:lipoyl(octanoyl) transferase